MDGPTRVPPRFVPTLTAVVDLEAEPAAVPATLPSPLPAEPEPAQARELVEAEPHQRSARLAPQRFGDAHGEQRQMRGRRAAALRRNTFHAATLAQAKRRATDLL